MRLNQLLNKGKTTFVNKLRGLDISKNLKVREIIPIPVNPRRPKGLHIGQRHRVNAPDQKPERGFNSNAIPHVQRGKGLNHAEITDAIECQWSRNRLADGGLNRHFSGLEQVDELNNHGLRQR